MSSIPHRLPSRPDDIALLLGTLHPIYRPGEVSETRYINSDGELQREFHRSAASITRSVERHKHYQNIYVGLALRDGQGGTAEHCTRVTVLWCDADFKLWRDEPDPCAAAWAALRRFGLPATAVVCTGNGLHVYLGLSEPVGVRDHAARDRFEAINSAFARALCGPDRKPDAVHDVPRILRVPGTFNFKSTPPAAVNLEWCDPARRYGLDDIVAYLDTHHAWSLDTDRPPRSTGPAQTRTGERATVGAGGRPGDDFNRRGDVRPILRRHGWQYLYEQGGKEYWQRPHKAGRGTSATFNYADSGLFYVFSAEGAPFAPLRAYTPFAVYALLDHRGDYAAAARALAREGYGQDGQDGQDGRAIHLTPLARPAGRRLPDLARPLGCRLAEVTR